MMHIMLILHILSGYLLLYKYYYFCNDSYRYDNLL